MDRPTILQVNLSPTLGGAEVYTAFFSRALAAKGWPTSVFVNAEARYWDELDFGGVARIPLTAATALPAQLPTHAVLVVHAPLPVAVIDALPAGTRVIALAHQAIYDGRFPAYYARADRLFGVSNHVLATLREAGLSRAHPEPLLGVGDVARTGSGSGIGRGPLCEWDEHKLRDRLMRVVQGAVDAFRPATAFRRRPGLTLGIVSRLAPLKQFPLLFAHIAPVLARLPNVHLEIFGAAVGYKSLQTLRAAVAPMGRRVRFWGHQRDVAATYRAIDYLLTGLPEREALGLNVIESCLVGTPVLAVAAPPFTETMRDGVTGFLYRDPREDNGVDFGLRLAAIAAGDAVPDLAGAALHLATFGFGPFADRVDSALRATLGVSA